jgi:hypothetical protein
MTILLALRRALHKFQFSAGLAVVDHFFAGADV